MTLIGGHVARWSRYAALSLSLFFAFVEPPVLAQDAQRSEPAKRVKKVKKKRKKRVKKATPRRARRETRSKKRKKKATKPARAPSRVPTTASESAPDVDTEIVKEGETNVKVMRFGGLSLEGRLKSPQLLYFVNRVHAEFDRPKLPHRSFMPELERSTKKDPL